MDFCAIATQNRLAGLHRDKKAEYVRQRRSGELRGAEAVENHRAANDDVTSRSIARRSPPSYKEPRKIKSNVLWRKVRFDSDGKDSAARHLTGQAHQTSSDWRLCTSARHVLGQVTVMLDSRASDTVASVDDYQEACWCRQARKAPCTVQRHRVRRRRYTISGRRTPRPRTPAEESAEGEISDLPWSWQRQRACKCE